MLHFPCISQGNKGCDLYIPFAPFYLLINHCLLLVVLYGITRPLPSGNVSDKISFQQYSSLSVITPSTLLSTNKMVISSVQFSYSVVSESLWLHESQHARPPCPSPTPRVHSDSRPSSQWCHPTISSSVVPFSFPQSFPASGSFPMSQFFASGTKSIGVSASASVLPMNIQGWSPLEWTGWISLQSKGLSRVFSNITVQKHQFFSSQLSL